MNTILVPTDYSEPARNAAVYAIQLAKELGASVRFFHAYHVPASVPDYVPGEMNDRILNDLEQRQMQRYIHRLEGKYGVKLTGQVSFGFAADEILLASDDNDIIVMGMQGGSMLKEILGSVSTKVMKNARVPVLLVPQDAGFAKPVNVIVASNSAPDISKANAIKLKVLLSTLGADAEVLYVSKPGEPGDNISGVKKAWADKFGTIAKFTAEEAGHTLDAIFSYTHGNNAGLLVMFPHKYGPLDQIFHSSATRKIALRTDIPVLVIPETHEKGGTWLF